MPETYLNVRLDLIEPSPFNPRKTFDPAALEDLAQTIREHGVLEPAVVRPKESGTYELVMGERRFRASKLAGREDLPCIVRDYTDAQVLEVIVIENNQRADVNAAEESEGFAAILNLPDYQALGKKPAVEHLAKKLGRSVSYVWQRLKLADLTDEAREELHAGAITPGHSILLARLDPETQADMLTTMLYKTSWNNKTQKEERGERRETGCRLSVRELASAVRARVGVLMESAPFDATDAVEGIGRSRACLGCPARTTSDPDAGEGLPDACRDGACFKAKCAAHVSRRIEEARQAHPDLVLVSREWQTTFEGAITYQYWNSAEPGAKGARPAVVVESRDSKSLGISGYVTLVRPAHQKSDAEIAEEERQAEETARKVGTENRYRRSLLEAIVAAVTNPVDAKVPRLAAMAVRSNVYGDAEAKIAAEIAGVTGQVKRDAKPAVYDAMSAIVAARYFVALTGCEEAIPATWNYRQDPRKLLFLASVYGVDVESIRNEAYGQGKLLFESPVVETPADDVSASSLLDLIDQGEEAKEAENRSVLEWAKSTAMRHDVGAEIGLVYEAHLALFDGMIDATPSEDRAARSRILEQKNGGYVEVSGRRFVVAAEGLDPLSAEAVPA